MGVTLVFPLRGKNCEKNVYGKDGTQHIVIYVCGDIKKRGDGESKVLATYQTVEVVGKVCMLCKWRVFTFASGVALRMLRGVECWWLLMGWI